jgi:RNA polymerase sigma-70 factor (ECF subfamily)
MSESELDVATCLEGVRQGDDDAAERLVAHLYPLVIRIVRRHLPRRSDEEDLAQEIFMKMFSKLDQYKAAVPLEHWVSRISVNTCLNQIRGEKSRPELRWADLTEENARALESVLTSAEDQPPSNALEVSELASKLLQSLPPKDRLVLQFMEMDGYTVEEIRKRTGWSGTAIRVRAFRARNRLRKTFAHLKETKS